MSRYLLDVNVLIALIDANHVHHDRAHQWFAAEGVHAWATCATTENGLLRIVGNPRYRPIKLIKTYLLSKWFWTPHSGFPPPPSPSLAFLPSIPPFLFLVQYLFYIHDI